MHPACMDEDNSDETFVSSDIHINDKDAFEALYISEKQIAKNCKVPVLKFFQSRFVFDYPENFYDKHDRISKNTLLQFDEDGDVIRREKSSKHVISIEYCVSTPLRLVGLQVWSACLLLADYLLFNQATLRQKCAVELGAGIGICSMIVAMFSEKVFCTDCDDVIMSLCEKNIKRFLTGFSCYSFSENLGRQKIGVIKVKELNWCLDDPFSNMSESGFKWTEEEMKDVGKAALFIASDVIYDDDLTNAFFNTVTLLMKKAAPSCLILSLEKRENFTIEALGVSSPSYEHFKKHIDRMISKKCDAYSWEIQNIATNFPQYFHYKRTQQLELWRFECIQR